MKKGIGPNNLGSPAKMGHGMKTMAKMYDSPNKMMGGMMKPDASPAKDYKKGYYGK